MGLHIRIETHEVLTKCIQDYTFVVTDKKILTEDNGSRWKSMGKLWIPYEKEVFGINKYSDSKYEYEMKQYHSFKEIKDFKIKCDYKWNTKKSSYWWTASAEKGLDEVFCIVSEKGNIHHTYASYSNIGVPLCFRFI